VFPVTRRVSGAGVSSWYCRYIVEDKHIYLVDGIFADPEHTSFWYSVAQGAPSPLRALLSRAAEARQREESMMLTLAMIIDMDEETLNAHSAPLWNLLILSKYGRGPHL
jgi:hypothetical protein